MKIINFLNKYILRRDFYYKVKEKLSLFYRNNFKDPFHDQKKLLSNTNNITIFDVGSHFGDTVKKYRFTFPKSKIFAFEPTPKSYKKLIKKFKNDDNVIVSSSGLSNKKSMTTLYLSDSENLNSFKKPNQRAWGFDKKETILVQTDTLDNICAINNINNIDILKIDVQGNELEVLHGGCSLLSDYKIGLIFVEWQVVPLYQKHYRHFEISQFLNKYGYDLFNIYNINEARSGQLRWGDSIFINQKIKNNLILKYGKGQGSGW